MTEAEVKTSGNMVDCINLALSYSTSRGHAIDLLIDCAAFIGTQTNEPVEAMQARIEASMGMTASAQRHVENKTNN